MKDGIIKNTGDSRYIKSVGDFLSRYPTYESFAAAMATGRIPVDFDGINESGWVQVGTPINKANTLPEDVVSSLGLTASDPTIADALRSIATKNEQSLKIEIGSYYGTGATSTQTVVKINSTFTPYIVVVARDNQSSSYSSQERDSFWVLIRGAVSFLVRYNDTNYTNNLTWSDRSVEWQRNYQTTTPEALLNKTGERYKYAIVGY